LIKEILYR